MNTRIVRPSGICLAIAAAFVAVGSASAADRLVPKQYATIQAAINASSNGDVVQVAPGTYSELIRFYGKAITVRASGAATDTFIDGGQRGTTVKFANSETAASVLEGFTISNGKAAVGGGMYINSASPTIRNCVISGNTALDRGAGVAVVNGLPTFTTCTFSSNVATERGGGAYLMVNSDVVFTQCTFTSNLARNRNGNSDGGAVAAENGADPTFNYCTFNSNKAETDTGYTGDARGGAVWLNSVTGMFEGCGFTSNAANPRGGNGEGGAVWASVAPSIQNCTFASNVVQQSNANNAAGRGGAVYLGAAGVFAGNTLSSNRVQNFFNGFGGALWVNGALFMQECIFASNSNDCYYDGTYGGAVYAAGTMHATGGSASSNWCRSYGNPGWESFGGAFSAQGAMTLNGVTFTSNGSAPGSAVTRRGGACQTPSNFNATGCTFLNNSTPYTGGVLYVSGGSVTFTDCTASGNTSQSGGVLFQNSGGSSTTFTNCTVTGNTSQGNGGVIYAPSSSTINLTNVTATGNASQSDGGVIYAPSSSSVTFAGFTATGNTTQGSGGVIYAPSSSSVTFADFTATGNTSQGSGGVAYLGSTVISVTGSALRQNTCRGSGGAIYCSRANSVQDSTFEENQCLAPSGSSGGALYCEGGSPSDTMTNVRFIGNAVTNTSGGSALGGAIRGGSIGSMSNCEFRSNSATGSDAYGGAIYGNDGSWSACTFASNSASTPAGSAYGGALNIDFNGRTASFVNCSFANNNTDGASTGGGAIRRSIGEFRCTDCTFSGNSAQRGGATWWEWNGNDYPVAFARCAFEKNSGAQGAGIYVNYARRFEMTGCTFALNLAFNEGGALWLRGYCMYSSQLSGNTFYGNIANNGGGLWMDSGGCGWSIPLTNCLFASNSATSGGGIYNAGSTGSAPVISSTTFCGNNPQDVQGYWQNSGNNIFGAGSDCNANGVCDGADIGLGTSQDCNANGVPDECDISGGTSSDVNGNGTPDSCEPDCDLDGIPDAYAVKNGLVADCNSNAQPDSCDIARGFSEDDNQDGIPDSCAVRSAWPPILTSCRLTWRRPWAW